MINQEKHNSFWFSVGQWIVAGAFSAIIFYAILLPAFRYWTQ